MVAATPVRGHLNLFKRGKGSRRGKGYETKNSLTLR